MAVALQCFVTLTLVVQLGCGNPQHYPPFYPEPPCDPPPPPPPHYPPPPYYPPPPPPPHYPHDPPPPHHAPPPPFEPALHHPHYPPLYEPPLPPYPPHYTHQVPAVALVEHPDQFPNTFSFGVGNGAYHIEGAWDQDCKGENIWDRWTHTNPEAIVDGSNGDVSADAYNHIREDVEIFNNLTIRHYRFSISWSRILPTGCGDVNPLGIEHYKQLIHLLKINQIEPFVTIYHGDLPQPLQDQGGMLCPTFIDWYTEYARVLFDHFGDDVKYWFTFNDPGRVCKGGYAEGTYAPGYTESPPYNQYLCGHNLLKAHAAVYHMYDECYRPTQKGKLSLAIEADWFEPGTNCESDILAADTALQFQLGWWAHPLYIGDYPPIMIEKVAERSEYEGLSESRLPRFTLKEIEYIKGTHDFFSLTYITFNFCTELSETAYWSESCYDDVGVEVVQCEGDDTPGIRKLINWIKDHYHNPSLFIVNNGYALLTRDLDDDLRVDYIKKILKQIRLAMLDDDARVYGYTHYSYIDGFEWTGGYQLKFGLYDVEFDCPAKTRTPRKSALYFQQLCQYGCIEDYCPPVHYLYD